MRPATLLLTAPLAWAAMTGCAARIDRFTVDRVTAVGLQAPDTGKVCALGAALVHPLASVSKNEPHKALAIAELVSALCAEEEANEAELALDRAKANFSALGDARADEITDARLRSERAHTVAADRFERSWQHVQAEWGPLGDESCPRLAERDEIVYVLGTVAGTLALIHDRRGGGVHGIPLDRLLEVARASECVDDATWWHVPSALRAGAWATIPGSGPAGVDAWAMLAESAEKGEQSGVRVARAMQALIAGNSGVTEVVEAAIRAHRSSIDRTPQAPEWALLDQYATEVTLHESDRLWTAATGHRTERFGALPSDVVEQPTVPDLFSGSDPFGAAEETPAPEAPPLEETP
jgi:hypothetical protein